MEHPSFDTQIGFDPRGEDLANACTRNEEKGTANRAPFKTGDS